MARFFLLAAALLCVSASPASAALQVCNRTSYVLYSASATVIGNNIASKGWTRIAPGACQTLFPGDLISPTYYLYARTSQAHSGPTRAWGGDRPICVEDVNFTSRDSAAVLACQSDSFFTLPFASIDTHHMKSWTATLSESSSITTLPAARTAGFKRLLRDLGYKIAAIDGRTDPTVDAALVDFRKRQRLASQIGGADLVDALETAALKVAAPAGYAVCNDTTKPVAAAIGEKTGGTWVSHGWWKIAAGSCAKTITAPLATDSVYLFVQKIAGPALVAGRERFCVTDIEFDIQGRSRCKARGLNEIGFAETLVRGLAGYAVHVGEGGIRLPASRYVTISK